MSRQRGEPLVSLKAHHSPLLSSCAGNRSLQLSTQLSLSFQNHRSICSAVHRLVCGHLLQAEGFLKWKQNISLFCFVSKKQIICSGPHTELIIFGHTTHAESCSSFCSCFSTRLSWLFSHCLRKSDLKNPTTKVRLQLKFSFQALCPTITSCNLL